MRKSKLFKSKNLSYKAMRVESDQDSPAALVLRTTERALAQQRDGRRSKRRRRNKEHGPVGEYAARGREQEGS